MSDEQVLDVQEGQDVQEDFVSEEHQIPGDDNVVDTTQIDSEGAVDPEIDIRDLYREVQRLSTSLGRVKKSLFSEPPPVSPQAYAGVPQNRQQYNQNLNQVALQPDYQGQQDVNLRKMLVDTVGEEAAEPLERAIAKLVNDRVGSILSPYSNALDQVSQAIAASQMAGENMKLIKASFPDVKVKDVAAVMRKDGVPEDEIRAFESNPGFFPYTNVAKYYRAAGGKTAADVVNRAKQNSKPVLPAKANGNKLPASEQLKGKTEAEMSVILRKNPQLRAQVLKEKGLSFT